MSDEQRTPQNELICEQMLGWRRAVGGWIKQDGFMYGGCGTPSFTSWAEAGLILEALSLLKDEKPRCGQRMAGDWYCVTRTAGGTADTGPLAVRAAALEYITSMQPSTSDLIMARGDGG